MTALTEPQIARIAELLTVDIDRPVNRRDVYLDGDVYVGSLYVGWLDPRDGVVVYDRYVPWRYINPDGSIR